MFALFSLFIIVVLSVIVIRIGAVMLELTGVSPEVASFQAQSAFSGVGFTTSESEIIVNHPARRKILRILILLGNAGITSSIATLVLTFIGQTQEVVIIRGVILLVGLLGIFVFARSSHLYNIMKKIICRFLKNWQTLNVYDYEELLGLNRGYMITKIVVKEDSWLSNKKLKDLKLEQEGLMVLSIYRNVEGGRKQIGLPSGDTEIKPHDVLVCYSRSSVSRDLARRVKGVEGDREHERKVDEERLLAQMRKARGGFD
ncbi:MAG: potassium transporter TrkA [Candidatus Omnitrophica bacterium 4484_70.1]|nr:MAG: potassium transporter TrkA [Candidatus Omnitrophica bacterium 4484_70.1]